MSDTQLDVVIVTFNSGDVLDGLLDGLQVALEQLPNTQIIVPDNDSRDNSVQIASRHPIGARIVQVGYNSGYAAGINAAVAQHGRDGALLLLNADIRLGPDCITKMLASLRAQTPASLCPERSTKMAPSVYQFVRSRHC